MTDGKYWDSPLNPIVHSNCSCEVHCWAKGGRFKPKNLPFDKNGVAWMPEKFKAVSLRGKSKIYFICNTCDIGHNSVNKSYIKELEGQLYLINVRRENHKRPPHIFLILTKWPKRLSDILLSNPLRFNLAGIYMGTTITGYDQKIDNARLDGLMKFAPYYPLWLSIESLLNYPKVLDYYNPIEGWCEAMAHASDCNGEYISCPVPVRVQLPKVSQVIIGGETGAKARPMKPEWVYNIWDMCKAAGLPFYFKSWGKHIPEGETDRTLGGMKHNNLIWRPDGRRRKNVSH